MDQVPPPPVPTQLIVFADDWGRHPSSSQHLIRELLPHYPTLWVNTTGTRKPRLCWTDIKRGFKKLNSILAASSALIDHMEPELPENLYVIEPFMYPGFRNRWQRWFNRRKLTRAIHGCFGETVATTPLFVRSKAEPSRRVVITTLPITADLIGTLHADRWVYYCVDDYSQWPGTDSAVMDQMERELVRGVDGIAVVSEVLSERVIEMNGASQPELLSHGVDASFWHVEQACDADVFGEQANGFMELNGSPLTFWGLIDERLDKVWLSKLSRACVESMMAPLKVCLVGQSSGIGRVGSYCLSTEHAVEK